MFKTSFPHHKDKHALGFFRGKLGNKTHFFIGLTFISRNCCIFASVNKKNTKDMATKTPEQTIIWLKAAQTRQQEWQQEVRNRWASKQQSSTNATV